MKFIKILLILILCIWSSGKLQSQENTKANIKISKINKNAYIFTSYSMFENTLFPANGMLLVSDSGIVMLDTPWKEEQCKQLLDTIQKLFHKKIVAAIATHFHADRTGSFDYLNRMGIKTFSSLQTLELCKSKKEQQASNFFVNDTVFTVGKFKIETYNPGAGHAPDNIVIWIPRLKILYGGCFIKSTESKGIGNLSDADLVSWKTAAMKVKRKYPNCKLIIPGHFSWNSKNSINHTIELVSKEISKIGK